MATWTKVSDPNTSFTKVSDVSTSYTGVGNESTDYTPYGIPLYLMTEADDYMMEEDKLTFLVILDTTYTEVADNLTSWTKVADD